MGTNLNSEKACSGLGSQRKCLVTKDLGQSNNGMGIAEKGDALPAVASET